MEKDPLENCSVFFTEDQVRSLTIARATTGAVCFLANALTLLAIIFYQAWRTPLQRILLYLSVASLLFSLSYLIPTDVSPACIAAGFLEEWFGLSVIILTYCATIYLLSEHVAILLKTKQNCPKRKWLLIFEIIAIFCGFVLPVVFPASQHHIGIPYSWCLTANVSNFNCMFGETRAIIYIQLFFLSIIFIFVVALPGSFLIWACVFKPPAKAIVTILVKGLFLWLFTVLYTTVSMIEFLYFFVGDYKLRLAYTVFKPLFILSLPSAFWFYWYGSGKNLNCKRAIKQWDCFLKSTHQPALPEGELYTEFIDPSSEGTLSYRPPVTSDSYFLVNNAREQLIN